jgi:hypothetical protein
LAPRTPAAAANDDTSLLAAMRVAYREPGISSTLQLPSHLTSRRQAEARQYGAQGLNTMAAAGEGKVMVWWR